MNRVSGLRPALRAVTALAGLAAFAALVYVGLTWDLRDTDSDAPRSFERVAATLGELPEVVVATGHMSPFAQVVVQSEIPGIVSAVLAHDGDRVERGQPIIELDRTRLEDQASVLRAALELEQARARIDEVARAEADLDKVRADHARMAELFSKGVASTEQLEDLDHRLRVARLALHDAQAEMAARRAAVKQAERSVQRIERDLEKSIIRSPVDGVLVRREVEVGAAVADLQNGGTVVAVLADDQKLHMVGDIDENDIAKVREGQPAEVRIDAFPQERFAGRVRKISSSGRSDGNVSRFEVEVELDPDPRVRIGMSADARIEVGRHEDVVIVPNRAIEWDGEGAFVRVVADNGAPYVRRRVRTIYSDGFQTAIAEGVDAGAEVLVRVNGTH